MLAMGAPAAPYSPPAAATATAVWVERTAQGFRSRPGRVSMFPACFVARFRSRM